MKTLNDLELEQALHQCVRREREATAEVLRYLKEVEGRYLYLARGYSSLFAYCTGKLGYSEPEAQLRIQAMRLIRALPEVATEIESGALTISVAAQIQGAARREKLGPEQTRDLVKELSGSSKREAEKKLAAKFPEAICGERTKPITIDLSEIRFTITNEEMGLIQKLMDLTAHKNFSRKYEKLFMDLVRTELQKHEKEALPHGPDLVKVQKLNQEQKPGAPRSRYIPAAIKRQIWSRDQGQCQYIDPMTKKRCITRHGIQMDHIKNISEGGMHSTENLRLYCGAHNRNRNRWRPIIPRIKAK